MLVVKIELWPKGDANKAREIGRTYIANIGGSVSRGNYQVLVCKKGLTVCPFPINSNSTIKAVREGEVKNFPRLSYSVWRLVIRALKSAFPEESK